MFLYSYDYDQVAVFCSQPLDREHWFLLWRVRWRYWNSFDSSGVTSDQLHHWPVLWPLTGVTIAAHTTILLLSSQLISGAGVGGTWWCGPVFIQYCDQNQPCINTQCQLEFLPTFHHRQLNTRDNGLGECLQQKKPPLDLHQLHHHHHLQRDLRHQTS